MSLKTWIRHQADQHRTVIAWFTLTFLVILPFMCKDNPHSPYFKFLSKKSNITTRLKWYNILNSKHYSHEIIHLANLSKLNREKLSSWDTKAAFRVLVTIITTSRTHHGSALKEGYQPHYLAQVIARYARIELNRSVTQLSDLRLLVCNVDNGRYKEAMLMSSVVEVLHKRADKGRNLDMYELEKRDYANCLKQSIGYQADYVLLVEDDALPHFDLLDKLDHLFSYRFPRMNNTFGYVKLFHPSRLNGFITADANRLLEWVAIAGLLQYGVTFFLLVTGAEHSITWRQRVTMFVYFMLLLLAVGRINIERPRTLSPHLYRLVPSPSCCTPAILFTPYGAQQMVHYLNTMTCSKTFAKDSAMDAFASVTGLKSWFFEPKLYNHIGVYTTRDDKVVDPAIVD